MTLSYRRATSYPTPFHGAPIKPKVFVLHTTEGEGRTYLDGLFSGKYPRKNADGTSTKVSVHWAIYLNGDIVEYAPWMDGEAVECYHAGVSSWHGAQHVNKFSLGVEIEHVQGKAYPEAQVAALCDLAKIVHAEYPEMALATHASIAPGRKIDPTNWDDIKGRVMAAWEEEAMVRHVADTTYKPELDKLVRAGIITKPEAYDEHSEVQDAAGSDWVIALLGRVVEKAGLVPPQ